MKRIEIIANHSVEVDIIEGIRKAGVKGFTLIPSVHGMGNTNPKMGSSVWPEENFILIIYTEGETAEKIAQTIAEIKIRFPSEGIKYFVTG